MKTGRKTTGWSRRSLARLAYDTAGNTMLILAAAMFPIIGMAGSAFDMGRAYMVKSRLQQACDAGALAGRRAMTTSTFDAAAKAEADRFFAFNYPDGSFGTTDISFTPTGTNDGQVTATATATVPMTLMKIFSVPEMALTVNCDARLEIANNDIVFVLDVTGSMAQSVNGTVKIVALRDAVNGFYDVLDDNTSSTARVRYGFAPFSAGVNVGQLLLDAGMHSYLADSHTYQSRVANFNTEIYAPSDGTPTTATEQIYGSSISQSNCTKYGGNQSFSGFTGGSNPVTLSGGPPPNAEHVRLYSNNSNSGVDWGWSGASDTSGNSRSCRRRYVEFERTYTTRWEFTSWTWKPVVYDTSQYKLGNSVLLADTYTTNGVQKVGGTVASSGEYNIQQLATAATGTNSDGRSVTTTSYSWNRCIEERKSVANATFDPLPPGAHDLNVDEIPYDDDTRWKPIWSKLVNNTNQSGNPSTVCPAAARRLGVMTASEVSTYVNSLQPTGNTYLDFGMIWGARLISPSSIFGADNQTAPNGRPIGRHVIFMTDGLMEPNNSIYNLYGYEPLDRRVSGTSAYDNASLAARHKQRFLAVCTQLREMNVTVWTIAFATAQEPEMVTCATPGKAFVATTTDDLKNQFKEIANRIANLRLAK